MDDETDTWIHISEVLAGLIADIEVEEGDGLPPLAYTHPEGLAAGIDRAHPAGDGACYRATHQDTAKDAAIGKRCARQFGPTPRATGHTQRRGEEGL